MRIKQINLTEDTFLNPGEKRITPLVYTKGYGFELDDRKNRKSAACPEALEFASHIKPVEGQRFVLVSAMGSYEFWGDNKKADAFLEAGLLGGHPKDVPMSFFSKYSSRIPKEWGYKCFVTKFDPHGNQIGGGNTFHEHQNRFPKELLGKPVIDPVTGKQHPRDTRAGYILAAFWNPKMHRVELIKTVWTFKLPHIVQAIDEGKLPGISMACDIPFDRCSICGNLAPTQFDYCECLQMIGGKRGMVLPDGRTVVMHNDYAGLFDSSFVANRAATEAGTLMKIASGSSIVVPRYHKEKIDNQRAVIEREKLARLQQIRVNEPSFSDGVAKHLRSLPLNKAAACLGILGMYPTGTDLAKIMFGLSGKEASFVGTFMEYVLPQVLENNLPVKLNNPKLPVLTKVASDTKISADDFAFVADITESYMPLKSYLPDYLPFRKEAAIPVDLEKPLSSLNDATRALLLTRVFMDQGMMQRIKHAFVDPVIRYELDKRNLGAINTSSSLLPVYSELADGYISNLGSERARFYSGSAK